jgi:hypothetical protein
MKIINWSSKKFGSLEILVDDEDYEKIKRYPWGVLTCKNSDVKYVKSRNIDPDNMRKYYSLHRFVLGLEDPKIFVDHKDGNGLNNQKSNLRVSTIRQNCSNRGKQKNNKSVFKGVTILMGCHGRVYKKPSYKVNFAIRDGNKRKYIFSGQFKTPQEAAIKYNELARIYHGEFAYQNPV